jgi:hypothetical protein
MFPAYNSFLSFYISVIHYEANLFLNVTASQRRLVLSNGQRPHFKRPAGKYPQQSITNLNPQLKIFRSQLGVRVRISNGLSCSSVLLLLSRF